MAKKWLKYPIRVCLGVLGLILVYCLVAVILSLLGTRPVSSPCTPKAPLFVASNGAHLEVVLPRDHLSKALMEKLKVPPWASYVAFGWGDRDFYLNTPTWEEMDWIRALRAVLLPTKSAVHVTWYAAGSDNWHQLVVCETQYANVNTFLLDSFSKRQDGSLRKIDHPGYTERDIFYEAEGRYSFIRTCNNWVNQALRQAGQKTALWSPFEFGVLFHLPEGQAALE